MSDFNDDIIEVCEAVDILNGKKRSQHPTEDIARSAIAAWERVDQALYRHLTSSSYDQVSPNPMLTRHRSKP